MNEPGERRTFPILFILATLIFLVDIRLPRGATLAICYLPLLIVAAGFRSPRPVFALAVICTLYTVADVYLSPPNAIPYWVTLNNRGLTLAALWFVVLLATTPLRYSWIGGLYGAGAGILPAGSAPAGAGLFRATLESDIDHETAESTLNAGVLRDSAAAERDRRLPLSGRGRPAARRIAIIAHSNAPWTAPYARFFDEQGRIVRVISFHPDGVPGIETVFVGHEPFDPHANKHQFVTRVPHVRNLLRDFRPDVVLACYVVSNGLTAAMAWDGPLVVSARGGCVLRQTGTGAPGMPSLFRRRLLRFVCGRAGFVHAVSSEIRDALVSIGVAGDKIACFPLGVDLEEFPCAAHPPAPGEMPHVICTRRHEPVYQNHVIVEALSRLRRTGETVRCTFVGGGTLLDDCRARVRAAGLEDVTTFTGQRPPEELAALLRTAHVYVSASRSDGTSTSLLEAMATGLYPVVTNIRANRDWICDGETGRLFRVGDAAALADAISDALGAPDRFAAAARANRERVQSDGDRRQLNARLLALLDAVVAARSAQRDSVV